MKAVFLDRDGVVIVEKEYLSEPKLVELIPGTAEAIVKLNAAGYLVVVVSNQAGVARGYFDEKSVVKVNNQIDKMLKEQGAKVAGYYYCPHHPEFSGECECRKPHPGMLLEAAKEFNIDSAQSFMIGDKLSDIEAGEAVGATSLLVLTGYGKEMLKENPELQNFDNLLAAADWIIEQDKKCN